MDQGCNPIVGSLFDILKSRTSPTQVSHNSDLCGLFEERNNSAGAVCCAVVLVGSPIFKVPKYRYTLPHDLPLKNRDAMYSFGDKLVLVGIFFPL